MRLNENKACFVLVFVLFSIVYYAAAAPVEGSSKLVDLASHSEPQVIDRPAVKATWTASIKFKGANDKYKPKLSISKAKRVQKNVRIAVQNVVRDDIKVKTTGTIVPNYSIQNQIIRANIYWTARYLPDGSRNERQVTVKTKGTVLCIKQGVNEKGELMYHDEVTLDPFTDEDKEKLKQLNIPFPTLDPNGNIPATPPFVGAFYPI